MDVVAGFDSYFKVLYDTYKWTMPTSRFFGYIKWLNKSSEEQNKTPHQKKVEELETLEEF